MKALFGILALLFISGCCTTPDPLPDPEPIVVGSYHDGSGDLGDKYLGGLKQKFEDGTAIAKIELKAEKAGYFLYREGLSEKKNCIVSRTPLDAKDGLLSIDLRKDGTETCTGDGCSSCAFKDTGGCTCTNSTNNCNHTISRNRFLYL